MKEAAFLKKLFAAIRDGKILGVRVGTV